jgi:predicted Fe-Mo cluster-binding NifX family protein
VICISTVRRFEMLVAVPLFRNEVSPRFGHATEVALARVESGKMGEIQRVVLPGRGGRQVYATLVSLKPAVVICGGIHRSWQGMLERDGIAVVWGVIGEAQDAISSYAAGSLRNNQFVCPGRRAGMGRGRRRRGKLNT